ncbi:exo-alpha-sialidase [Vibrio sinaloensis]|uniref:exo-alpha-sialidase n=1 Tax=Photobacterium sp. (strain ATCC 43367) TaxID=379097 RepID=UPI000AEAA518|nr:exo-alpha-sialidase [Vibrio sinaloensis]
MEQFQKKGLLAVGLLTLGMAIAPMSAHAVAPNLRDVVVFKGGEGGSSHYRIPSIVVAQDGSLVAFAEGRASNKDPGSGYPTSIKSRRSTDNGVTWSDYAVIHEVANEAYSDPRPFVDKTTGRMFVFYTKWDNNCAQNGNCVPFDDPKHKLFYRTSDDNGQTWSAAIDVLDQVKDVNWMANGTNSIDGRATWSATPSQAQIDQANSDGWSLSWNSRVADGSCNVQYYGNGSKRFLADLQVNADKSVKAVLYSDGANLEFPMDFDISAYHDYKIVGQGSTASFYVDGTLVATNWSGQSHSSKTVTWGNGCSSTKGASAYHTIDFSIADNQQFYFDASLMERVNGTIIKHPAEQGWTKTSARNGRGDPGWKSINAGPGQGIQLTNGRLIFPAIILDAFTQLSVVSIYSDDHGVTWHAGNQTPTYALEPSEADMVELNDGRLLMSARNDGVTGTGNFNRYHFVSSDRGVNWTMIEEERYSTNGALFFKLDQVDIGLLRYGDNRVLMSGPQGNSAVSSDRNDLAIWSAVDDGAGNYNFTQRTQFRDGYSAYSDLIQLQDKGASGNEDIGVIYEATSSTEIRFMVIDIDSVN